MSSRPSGSDLAFEQLHPELRRWIWQQGWPGLRPVQQRAIPAVLDRSSDVVIAAPTAGGKTEAAFLPILTDIAAQEAANQLRVICVSPLRALINDQTRRLESLAACIGARVQPWHGDVTRGRQTFWERPTEILITTPESLEAMLMRRTPELGRLATSLRFMVVDELHCFIGSERGAQLQSLLRRVERLAGSEIPRVALSATLGDASYAGSFLRPPGTRPVTIIQPEGKGGELKLIVKAIIEEPVKPRSSSCALSQASASGLGGSVEPPPPPGFEHLPQTDDHDDIEDEDVAAKGSGLSVIAEHLFERLRGDTHLVFANSRRNVETLAAILAGRCERDALPNEFFPHHGSLARELRLDVESRLRDGQLPTTAICTSTLEMGIDIGDIASIGQVGPAPSVSSLKQRVGRSGRRSGTAQTLRQYVVLPALTITSHPLNYLRLPLVQAIAQVELMIAGQFEPPVRGDLHLSTLVQQILSCIYASGGGADARSLFRSLGGPGPFAGVDVPTFAAVLRVMGDAKLLEQNDAGTLLPGELGEKLAEHYSFYASFTTPEEFQLIAKGRLLGSIPLDSPVAPGQFMLFGGRRWRIVEVRLGDRAILLEPARGGQPPDFGGNAPIAHALVHARMREVLSSPGHFDYLDKIASATLNLAREAFRGHSLDKACVLMGGDAVYLAHWSGSRIGQTLSLWLQRAGHQVENDGPFIALAGVRPEDIQSILEDALARAPTNASELTALVPMLAEEKFETWLSIDRPLLERGWAARWLDIEGARGAMNTMMRTQLH